MKKPRNGGRKVSLHSATPAATKVSLLHHYAPQKAKRKEAPRVIPVAVDDPFATSEPAFLRSAPRGAETVSENGEWVAPAKKQIELYATNNVVTRMYQRGQIDHAMWLAARDYEQTYATAMALRVKTIDPSAPVVSGGKGLADAMDAVLDASKYLALMEGRLRRRYGADAVTLAREVLGEGLTIERAARRRGDGNRQGVEWRGGTMRRCLQELAEAAGYAVRGAYRNRQREEERRERQRKHEEHRDKVESKRRKGKRNV